ncbi:hypothetical protein Hanom_Chr09g00814341 [Helianthus anomalus]
MVKHHEMALYTSIVCRHIENYTPMSQDHVVPSGVIICNLPITLVRLINISRWLASEG